MSADWKKKTYKCDERYLKIGQYDKNGEKMDISDDEWKKIFDRIKNQRETNRFIKIPVKYRIKDFLDENAEYMVDWIDYLGYLMMDTNEICEMACIYRVEKRTKAISRAFNELEHNYGLHHQEPPIWRKINGEDVETYIFFKNPLEDKIREFFIYSAEHIHDWIELYSGKFEMTIDDICNLSGISEELGDTYSERRRLAKVLRELEYEYGLKHSTKDFRTFTWQKAS